MRRVTPIVAVCIALLLACAPARAEPNDDPDTELAKRYFAEGTRHYTDGNYEAALERFRAAQRVKPLPQMEYNVARCLDRLDRPAEAIAAYERFLATPAGRDSTEVRARVEQLRARASPTSAAKPPRHGTPYLVPGIMLGVAAALAAAGTALWLDVGPRYDQNDTDWAARNDLDAVRQRARALHAQENAGYVLWGAAGAAAIADVALWIVAARHGGRVRAALPAATASGVTWSF